MVTYILYNSSVSAYHVPYTALTMHLSNVPAERDSATMYRILFEVIGTLIGATFQGQLTAILYGPIGL
jgi:Na+/melibiose symporter-like transporter